MAEILALIHPAALPIVITILGLFYIYRKIDSDRSNTKFTRDKDSQELHDDLLKVKFQVTELQGRTQHHATILEDLRSSIAILNTNIAKFSVYLENLNELMKNKSNEK